MTSPDQFCIWSNARALFVPVLYDILPWPWLAHFDTGSVILLLQTSVPLSLDVYGSQTYCTKLEIPTTHIVAVCHEVLLRIVASHGNSGLVSIHKVPSDFTPCAYALFRRSCPKVITRNKVIQIGFRNDCSRLAYQEPYHEIFCKTRLIRTTPWPPSVSLGLPEASL